MPTKDRIGKDRRIGLATVLLTCFLSFSVGTPVALAQTANTTTTKKAPAQTKTAIAQKKSSKPQSSAQRKANQRKAVIAKKTDGKKITVTRKKSTQAAARTQAQRFKANTVARKPSTVRSKIATVAPSATYQSVLTQTASDSGVRLQLPRLESQAAFVTDVETGMPLLAKNGNERRPIASITKIMSAMVMLDAGLDMNERIRVENSDVDRVKFSSSRLPVGTVLTRKELLNLSLMSSENRAAHALGRTYPGGLKAFVAAMNAKAKALGLTQSRFVEPTGLDPRNQASPRDLAHLVSAANQYKLIREFSTSSEEQIRTQQRAQMFRNTNALVRNDSWDISVSKTGYIREAGRCLVMHASVNNRPTLIVLLNSGNTQSRIRDSIAIKRWLEQQETQATLRAADLLLGKASTNDATS